MYDRNDDRNWGYDRHNRDRERTDWENRGNHGQSNYGQNHYGEHGRNWAERAGDEVRSWFGDDDAERRREIDERSRMNERGHMHERQQGTGWGGDGGRFGHGDRDRTREHDAGYNRQSFTEYGQHDLGRRDERSWGYNQPNSYGQRDYRQGLEAGYGGGTYNTYNRYGGDRGDYRGSGSGPATRDWSDRDREWHDRHHHERHDRGNGDRGFFERAGDEVMSWFGNDDAERRRQMDARRHPNDYSFRETFRHDERHRDDLEHGLDRDRERTWW